MESFKGQIERVPPHVPRLKLILGRFPLTDVREAINGVVVTVKMENVSITFPIATHRADVRQGDYFTLYTEVPLKERIVDANSLPPPVQ